MVWGALAVSCRSSSAHAPPSPGAERQHRQHRRQVSHGIPSGIRTSYALKNAGAYQPVRPMPLYAVPAVRRSCTQPYEQPLHS